VLPAQGLATRHVWGGGHRQGLLRQAAREREGGLHQLLGWRAGPVAPARLARIGGRQRGEDQVGPERGDPEIRAERNMQ
jgi:hypothetical protein